MRLRACILKFAIDTSGFDFLGVSYSSEYHRQYCKIIYIYIYFIELLEGLARRRMTQKRLKSHPLIQDNLTGAP